MGGARPERWRHVFASVQSLNAHGISNIPADAYEIVVIDEFHHAEAASYRRLMDHLAPKELLGLTATPRACRWCRRPIVLRWSHRCRASPVGCARRRPSVSLPLFRSRRRHRPAWCLVDARPVQRIGTLQRLYGQPCSCRGRAQATPGQDLWICERHAGARLLRKRRARGASWPEVFSRSRHWSPRRERTRLVSRSKERALDDLRHRRCEHSVRSRPLQ